MKIHACARLGLGALLFVGLLACEAEDEPSRIALSDVEAAVSAELCDRVFSCSCDQGRYYSDVLECQEDAARLAERLEDLPTAYSRSSLTYDPACVGQIIDQLAEIGCGIDVPGPPACERPCHYYFGPRGKGEACEFTGVALSDCAQGLECSGGRCIDPCGGLNDECTGSSCAPGLMCSPLSSTCRPPPEEGRPCLDNRCGDGFYCDFEDQSETCKALPAVGELCLDGSTCADGLFCTAVDPASPMIERRCFAPQPLQSPCQGHAQCESGYCPAAFCQARPGNGEACPAEVCAEGLDCVDEVCQPADAALCWASVP